MHVRPGRTVLGFAVVLALACACASPRLESAPAVLYRPREAVVDVGAPPELGPPQLLRVEDEARYPADLRDAEGPLVMMAPEDPLLEDVIIRGRRLPMVANFSDSYVYPPETGIVSYYYSRGRLTACMERPGKDEIYAAHKQLPFGTVVRCTRTDTGQSIVVTIKDRGPYIEGRILDLSSAAARRLDLMKVGVAPCVVEVLAYPLVESMGPKGNG